MEADEGKRPFNRIEYCNRTRQANIAAKKGEEQETAGLNINLKNANKHYLQHLPNLHEGPHQAQVIQTHLREDANFHSTRKLFGVASTKTTRGNKARR